MTAAEPANAPASGDPAAALSRIAPRVVAGAEGIAGLRRLTGGASQETWSFAICAPGGPSQWILRRSPPGVVKRSTLSCGLATEAELLERAHRAGVPVPLVPVVLAPSDGLGEGYVMSHVDGETIPRRILREDEFAAARPLLARQCGEHLARIHAIDTAGLPELRPSSPREELDAYRRMHRGYGIARPVFELAFRWLEDHLPPAPVERRLVHGDFRHGNLMIGPDGIRAVLDWELAHLGDPMEDLGWVCVNSWRFGNVTLPVGGFGTREELFAGYEAASGEPVDPAHVFFWEVLGTLKWGVMCEGMGRAFTSGNERTIERAAIGRRASETEIDLLNLIAPRAGA
jgi:aminoglycoside phosphotransferase (APT) family kinase protein